MKVKVQFLKMVVGFVEKSGGIEPLFDGFMAEMAERIKWLCDKYGGDVVLKISFVRHPSGKDLAGLRLESLVNTEPSGVYVESFTDILSGAAKSMFAETFEGVEPLLMMFGGKIDEAITGTGQSTIEGIAKNLGGDFLPYADACKAIYLRVDESDTLQITYRGNPSGGEDETFSLVPAFEIFIQHIANEWEQKRGEFQEAIEAMEAEGIEEIGTNTDTSDDD